MGNNVASRSRFLTAAALSVALVVPQLSFAQNNGVAEEEPSALAMVGDAIVARPLGLVFTVVGAAVYLVTLPFSLAGGNAGEAGKALVVGPAEATFVRCLGCSRSGYKHTAEASEPEAEAYQPANAQAAAQ